MRTTIELQLLQQCTGQVAAQPAPLSWTVSCCDPGCACQLLLPKFLCCNTGQARPGSQHDTVWYNGAGRALTCPVNAGQSCNRCSQKNTNSTIVTISNVFILSNSILISHHFIWFVFFLLASPLTWLNSAALPLRKMAPHGSTASCLWLGVLFLHGSCVAQLFELSPSQ